MKHGAEKQIAQLHKHNFGIKLRTGLNIILTLKFNNLGNITI